MTSVLLVTAPSPGMPDLSADLCAAGARVLGAGACHNLVQEAVRKAPDVVVCWAPLPDEPLFAALAALQGCFARPVLVFTDDVQAETLERALDAGVSGWVVQGYAAPRLRPLLQSAQARFRRERTLHESLRELTQRHQDRQLLDRAKGLLMRARGIDEDEAFRLLRGAAMQGQQRLGRVAQQVIEAAQGAQAVNRAGRLRMLSQRVVKLHALAAAGTEAAAAQALQAQSLAGAREHLAQLRLMLSAPTFGDLLQAVADGLDALVAAVRAPGRQALVPADEAAEQLLARADRLTAALESAGPPAMLRVVNLCGRQRMLSQRLAKQALLGAALSGDAAQAAAAGAADTIACFEAALVALKQAPLGTADLHAELQGELQGADADWQRLRQAQQAADTAAGRLALAATSEALLERFERLTGRCERHMELPAA